MKKFAFFWLFLGAALSASAQVYMEKQSRHRFAQLTLGLDVQTSMGGHTVYPDPSGRLVGVDLPPRPSPRLLIGGTHFWGHADFYIAIPLISRPVETEGVELDFLRGVETAFKYYPFRIQHGKVRPFLGVSLAPIVYRQNTDARRYGEGPREVFVGVPLHGGVTFNSKSHLFELGFAWNYLNRVDYHVSPQRRESISTPPFYAVISYRYMLETTLSAERDWESGRTAEVTEVLASRGDLDGWFVGVGFSSAFWLEQSEYNRRRHPYISDYGISLMPDVGLGYYFHGLDLNLNLAYRGYGEKVNVYGTTQEVSRKSLGVEATKIFADYHGFAPFVGPVVSFEWLAFEESVEGGSSEKHEDTKFAAGLTFGWDIRPNRVQTWVLRTNLRWFPKLSLDGLEGGSIDFGNVEFNFIQVIVYPGRFSL